MNQFPSSKSNDEIFNIIWFSLGVSDTTIIQKGENLARNWRQKAMAAVGRMIARKTRWKPWQAKVAKYLDISPHILDGLKRNAGFDRKVNSFINHLFTFH